MVFPPVAAYIPISLSEPPTYQNDKYELYRKEILRWADIRSGVPDQKVVAKLAIRSEGLPHGFSVHYMEQARNTSGMRKIAALIALLGTELLKTPHETDTMKIGMWSNFGRRSGEGIRQFLVRWERLQMALTKSNMIMPEAVSFHLALRSMGISHPDP